MRLAFLLQPRAESAFVLCHTCAAEMTDPQLCCIAAGKRVIFSPEDVEKRQNRAEFWQLALPILQRGRDLVLEYHSRQDAGDTDKFSPDELVAELERCPCLLPLHILGSYRSLDNLSELIILFVAQGSKVPCPLPQSDILENLPQQDWMLFAYPDTKKLSGKLHSLAGLLEVNPSLEQRLAELAAAGWKLSGPLRRIPLRQGKGWMEEIARSLNLVHLDLFHDGKGPVRKESPLTWEKDVFPAVLGSTVPFCATEDRPPILGGSMLESALSPTNREQLFLQDADSLREKVRHVILQGTTGTGKSTLGRLLLIHEVLHDNTARVVYMGPTRMLVEESYTAFCKLAAEISRQEGVDAISPEHIVISTGERMEQDERIRKGNFRALFIVYEKLNNFFHDRTLIRQVNSVMIDEVQMICNYARGGSLDIVLTSLCREADNRFNIEDCTKFLRLIICTTENFDFTERLTLHPGFRGKKRSPLILEDRKHFRKPSTWFQFRFNKKMYSLPMDFTGHPAKENIIARHSYLKYYPSTSRSNPHLLWLKEWMWGHEKVLYVFYDPRAMLSLATELAAGRPDMITDEALLARLHSELEQAEFNEQICKQMAMCARKGLFFNFATMGYAARETSADMFRTCPYLQGVPVVIFATSTIMYGVNLPADLLILKELMWPKAGIEASLIDYAPVASPYEKRFAYLRPCEVRNLAGRVGRQGVSNPRIVPTILYSSFVPKEPQKCRRFQKFIESLEDSQGEASYIFNRRKTFPRQLGDFSPVQQRFLMNCLLHNYDSQKGCSLEQVQRFIESTWAWERVRRDCEAEDWSQYIAKFFDLLRQEFPECLHLVEKREKIWLVPLPLCYSVCQTGSDLGTLKELRELLTSWDMQTYPQKAHTVIVLMSLIMTTEVWTLFLDFHGEARWGREELEENAVMFRLTDHQEACLEMTEIQEKAKVGEFREKLRAFMDESHIDAFLQRMRQVLDEKTLPMSLGKNIESMEKRKVLLAVRSVLALLAWCRGAGGEDIASYRHANSQISQLPDPFLLHDYSSFRDRFVMRLVYTLSALHVYCVESKSADVLTEAVNTTSMVLQQKQEIDALTIDNVST